MLEIINSSERNAIKSTQTLRYYPSAEQIDIAPRLKKMHGAATTLESAQVGRDRE